MNGLRRGSAFRIAAGAGMLAVLVAGCIFDTREAKDPRSVTPACPLFSGVQPDSVMQSLLNAVGCGNQGLSTYQELFTDDFSFGPDPSDSIEVTAEPGREGTYVDWTKAVETEVFSNIAADFDSMSLALTEVSRTVSPPEAELVMDYTLTGFDAGIGMEHAGQARFLLREEFSTWRIYRWEDVRTLTTSWGRLKADNRLGG